MVIGSTKNSKLETQNYIKYAIEDSFPIVEINRLAIPENCSRPPVYEMHRWFARRVSCVFRAILLGCMKPLPMDENGRPIKSGAEIIMEEFYKDHTNDPDTNGKVILDPFMGGGTTVVEALRLGCKVIGIDLNPVAWFIVKTEVEPVDIDELKASFERLAERRVTWSGRSVKETLIEQYKTECPCCGAGRQGADIIYTFWVKSAICTNPLCRREIPLFSDYIIADKSPSIKYNRDVACPECGKTFDWEVESASLIAEASLCVVSPSYSAGIGRTSARWSYALLTTQNSVKCPWCNKEIKPRLKSSKRERKKVPLTVLLCPRCYAVWQWRGTLPEEVCCPVCKKSYNPKKGNVPKKGWFLCSSCGHTDRIINSIRSLSEDQLLPMRPYAIEGYCKTCAGDVFEELSAGQMTLDGQSEKKKMKRKAIDHPCLLTKNKGKFFKRITPPDLARYQKACEIWEKEKKNLLYPKQTIPEGFNTNQMRNHHYHYWHQMFNPRQLLCLSTLLAAIDEESDQALKEMLLSAFYLLLMNNCMFCWYRIETDYLSPALARKDFAPVNWPLENSVWGTKYGKGTFETIIPRVTDGKFYCWHPQDRKFSGRFTKVGKPVLIDTPRKEKICGTVKNIKLYSASSLILDKIERNQRFDYVITDPPYAQNVNYSEVADFFYVWLRLILDSKYSCFAPEVTPKAEEIIQHDLRGKTLEDFQEELRQVFVLSGSRLKNDGLLVFTFHHEANATWDAVLDAIMRAGYYIQGVYPYESDARKGGSMGAQKIAYDLIHVCRKRTQTNNSKLAQNRSWAGIRQEIRRRAREEIKAIEAGRYGQESLSPADINIILIGKCLELYSRHYGAVVDHEGNEVTLKQALEEIRMMVDQLVTKEQPLPSELNDIDPESYVYLTCLCDRKEAKSDDVHKATRGILEPDSLIKAGIMIKGRTGRGRTYEVKQPVERFDLLLEKFKETPTPQLNLFGEIEIPKPKGTIYFIDYVHFLMSLVEGGENIMPWLERFRGETPRLRAACEFLRARNRSFTPTLKKILDLMDVGPLFQTR